MLLQDKLAESTSKINISSVPPLNIAPYPFMMHHMDQNERLPFEGFQYMYYATHQKMMEELAGFECMIYFGGLILKLGSLTFKTPDNVKYPSMDLAYAAGRAGGTMTGVLSAANEKAVEMFIDEKIGYLDIFLIVELTCDKHRAELVATPSLEEIVHYDLWARKYAASLQVSFGLSPVPT